MCIGQIFVRQSAKRHFAIWSILWALYNTHEDFIKTENTILARCCIKIQKQDNEIGLSRHVQRYKNCKN